MQNVITCVANGMLYIGVKKTNGNTLKGNRIVFDNFELYYLGTLFAIESISVANFKYTSAFCPNGTPVNSNMRGMIIQNGKKIMK